MGSVGSASSTLLNLLQNVAAASPQFSSVLSQPGVQSALQNASPGDLATLSDQAVQLQQMSALFGATDGTQSPGFTSTADSFFPDVPAQNSDAESNLMLQALQDSVGLTPTASTTSNTQVQQMETLFGLAPTGDASINLLG
jgi:hypothetical protein